MKTFLFAMMVALGAPQGGEQATGVIQGTVTRFGVAEPLANVEIVLRSDTPEAISDSAGHFVIRGIPPGTYTIKARRGGYANPAPNGVRIKDGGTTRTVTVTAGQHLEDVNLTMVVGGAVTGRVLDRRGKPFRGEISAVSSDNIDYKFSEINDRGEYHFVGLVPGRYYIVANGNDVVQTYFPGVADKTKATMLEIVEGTVLNAIDFTMQVEVEKTFKISGKVTRADGSIIKGMIQGIRLVPRGSNARIPENNYTDWSSGGSSADSTFLTFYMGRVRPGSYDVYLTVGTEDPFESGVVGRIAVDVGNQDLNDVTVVTGGTNVTGQLVVVDDATKPSGAVRLKMMPADVKSRKTKADSAGAFTIDNVLTGTWKVELSDLPANLAVLDIRQGKTSIYESGFAVEDRTPESVQVILGPGSMIEGTVRDAQQAPLGAAHVILIPDMHDPSRPALYRKTITDGAGRFTLPNVAIGNYRILALDSETFETSAIPDAADALRTFLIPNYQAQGTPLNVASKSKTDVSIVVSTKR